jgi:hypothetical protein
MTTTTDYDNHRSVKEAAISYWSAFNFIVGSINDPVIDDREAGSASLSIQLKPYRMK